MDEEPQRLRYRAFISYSHNDEKWAAWLHRAIETYRTPKQLVGRKTEVGPVPPRLMPVFRDRDELASSSDLSEGISKALAESDHLIVICSPNAAASHWVNEEIKTFKQSGRGHRLLAIIVAGEPFASEQGLDAGEECFPEALRFHCDENGTFTDARAEPIAADARPEGDGKAHAKIKLLAGLLGVGFDDLRQRESQRRQRQLVVIAAASLFAVLVTSGLAVAAWLARNDAVEQRGIAEKEAETALRSTDFLVSLFESSDPYAKQGEEVSVRALLESGTQKIERDLNDEPAVRGRLLNVMGRAYGNFGDSESAARLFGESAEAYGDVRVNDLDEQADNLTLRANSLANQNLFEEAEREGERAIALRRKLGDSKQLAISLYGHAQLLTRIDRREEAGRLFEEAASRFAALNEHPESFHYANVLTTYAMHLMGDMTDASDAKAAALSAQSLEIRARVQGKDHSSQTYDLHILAELAERRGDYVTAEKHYRESLRIDTIVYGENHGYVAEDLTKIGRVLRARGDMAEAEDLMVRALEIRKRVSQLPEEIAQSHYELGLYYRDVRNLAEAKRHLLEALRIDTEAFGPLHRKVCGDLEELGGVLLENGDLTAALDAATRAVAACSESYGDTHWRTASTRSLLGEIHAHSGDPNTAKRMLLDALTILKAAGNQAKNAIRATQERLTEVGGMLQGEDSAERTAR